MELRYVSVNGETALEIAAAETCWRTDLGAPFIGLYLEIAELGEREGLRKAVQLVLGDAQARHLAKELLAAADRNPLHCGNQLDG